MFINKLLLESKKEKILEMKNQPWIFDEHEKQMKNTVAENPSHGWAWQQLQWQGGFYGFSLKIL